MDNTRVMVLSILVHTLSKLKQVVGQMIFLADLISIGLLELRGTRSKQEFQKDKLLTPV